MFIDFNVPTIVLALQWSAMYWWMSIVERDISLRWSEEPYGLKFYKHSVPPGLSD